MQNEGKFNSEAPMRNESKRRSMGPIAVKDLTLTITSLLKDGVKAMVTCLYIECHHLLFFFSLQSLLMFSAIYGKKM